MTMRLLTAVAALSLSGLLMSCATASQPLPAAAGANASAAQHNAEGIEHYNMGHYDVAKTHFEAATKADPGSAEAHYNLALALDKLGAHPEATAHFKKAAELAPGNSAINGSSAYRGHVAPPAGIGPGSGVDRMGY
jgi:Tfp pilus assembly protein PilF